MYFLVELNTSETPFFPHLINKWNKLDPNIRSFNDYKIFRNTLSKFIGPGERKIFHISDSFGIKMLARLRLGFSHLREHKSNHRFKDTLNPLCSCSVEDEITTHCFKQFHFYNSNRATLMNALENIPTSFPTFSDNNLISLLLYGDDKFNDTKNQ